MYCDTGRVLPADRVEALVWLASRLDLDPLPGSVAKFAAFGEGQDGAAALLSPVLPAGPWAAAFVVSLLPMQQIPLHADASIAPATRYHVPIRTNAAAWCFHAGAWLHLEEGRAYRMDPTDLHGAVNWGTSPRWHVLVDIVEGA